MENRDPAPQFRRAAIVADQVSQRDARARELGLRTMVGCMCESSVGISAIAQLLPLLDYVDMDGAVLIAKDIATGVRVEKGRAIFPAENGNGVRLLPEFSSCAEQ